MSKELQDIKNSLASVFQKYGVKKASVFGSFARGDAQENSDVDLLVSFSDTTDLFDVFSMKEEAESLLKKEVDIVSEKSIISYFKDYIYKDLQLIYEQR